MDRNIAPHATSRTDCLTQIKDLVDRLTAARVRPNEWPESEVGDAIRKTESLLKTFGFILRGMLPFAYSYDFEDHRTGRTVGPITGIVWAKDMSEARSLIGRDVQGHQYADNITIEAMEFHSA